VIGSSVSVALLDATGAPTGQTFPAQTQNDRGEFQLTLNATEGTWVVVEATGYHYNEVSGGLSSAPLTLRSIATLGAGATQSVFVNVFTHLAAERIKRLASSGNTLAQSRMTAEQQLRAALGIGPAGFGSGVAGSQMSLLGGTSDANTYLFAVSVVFEQAAVLAAGPGGSVDAELQQLINLAAADLADDGAFQATLTARLREAERSVNVELVTRSFARRLARVGSSAEVPDLNRAIDTDGDGIPNASDPCPLQAGLLPSLEGDLCLQSVKLLDFGPIVSEFEAVLAPGLGGESVLAGRLVGDGGAGPSIGLTWLGTDGGDDRMQTLRTADGGTLASELRVSASVRLPGEAVIGTQRGGCAAVVTVSRGRGAKEEQLACGAVSYQPIDLLSDASGGVRAFWRGASPVNSTWTAISTPNGFGTPQVICAECYVILSGGSGGEAAASWLDTGVALARFRSQWSDTDGAWSAAEVAPFTSVPTTVMDGHGNVLAVWSTQSGNTSPLMWARHQKNGAWTTAGPIDPVLALSTWPLLAGAESGEAVTSWVRDGDAGYQVYGSAYAPDAGWAPAVRLGGTGTSLSPWSAQYRGRNAFVAWGPYLGPPAVRVRRYDAVRGWRPAQLLPRVANSALLALSESGEVRVVWSEPSPAGADFYTAVLR
jgi:hypothetical protein